MREWKLPDREKVRYEKTVQIEGSGLMFDYDDVDHDEAWAEAKLAAAAPDLLAACEAIKSAQGMTSMNRAWQMAVDAIAKAKL